MIKASFISRATELGFKPGSPSDPNETLAEIVESRIPAYWEAFPGLLVNAAEGGEFSPAATAALLDESGKQALSQLFLVSLGLYEALGEHFNWRRRLFPDLPARQVAGIAARLGRGEAVEAGGISLPAARLTAAFKRCRRSRGGLSDSLLQLFTPRQTELIFKRLRGSSLTKTEAEYFSRAIRPKVRALADEELHRLAVKLLG